MTVVIERARRIRYINEIGVAGFGVEQPIGNFVYDLDAREDSVKLTMNRPMDTPMLQQQHRDGYPSKVSLPRDAQLDFVMNVKAAGSRAGNGTTQTSAAGQSLLWQIALGGGAQLGIGTTISTTSTTTVLNVTSATGMREGASIACATGAGGALECREIKTVSGTTVTLKHALSAIPANGSTVYAASTVYLGNTAAIPQSMQFVYEGLGSTDRWLLKGGQVKAPPSFEFAPGAIPKVTWSWGFADHRRADGSESTMNLTAALADQAYADTGISSIMDSEFRVMTTGTSAIANTLIEAPEIKIAPNVKYVAHRTPSGVQTIKQWVQMRPDGPAVTGEFTVPFEDLTWFNARDNEIERSIYFQIGSSVTSGAVLFCVPRVCIDDVQLEEIDGIRGQRVKWYAKLDNQTTTNTSDLEKAAFRINYF